MNDDDDDDDDDDNNNNIDDDNNNNNKIAHKEDEDLDFSKTLSRLYLSGSKKDN